MAKGLPSAVAQDLAMAKARKVLDWDKQLSLAIDPVKAKAIRAAKNKSSEEYCSMCGDYCAVKIMNEYMDEEKAKKNQ